MAVYLDDDEEQMEYIRQYNRRKEYKRTFMRLAVKYFRLAWKCFKKSMKG